jgi:hypothetical protein
MKISGDGLLTQMRGLLSPKNVAFATICLALPQGFSLAQNMGVKPGLWEIEQIIDMPGAPQGSFRNKWQHCIKEEDAKKGPAFPDAETRKAKPKEEECRIENMKYPGPGHVIYDIVCGKTKVRIRAEYKYTETTFEGTSSAVGDKESFTYKMRGQYIGPCKK